MTIEQTIVDELLSLLGDISITNGYSFDIDGNVFEWRDTPLDDDSELPAISLRDTTNDIDEEDEQRHIMGVEVVLIDKGDNSPASIREKQQDVITAVSEITDHEEVEGAAFLGAEKVVEREKARYSASLMRFEITYYANLWTI